MSCLVIVQMSCLVAFALLLSIAGWQDLRTLHIADEIPLSIALAFIAWGLSGWVSGALSLGELGLAALLAIGVFALGALAFAGGVLGGGDVKLLAAASLFAGPTSLMLDYMLATALAGGVLALAILAGVPIGPTRPARDTTLRVRLKARLPYGPAIAAGGLWIAAVRALG